MTSIALSIWPLSVSHSRLDALRGLLSTEERSRAQRFRSPEAKRDYVVAHGVARELLSFECECAPGDIKFISARGGKPEIEAPSGAPRFSLAHGGQLVALAACRLGPLGVDIEPIAPVNDDLVCSAFSKREAAALGNVPAALKPTAFLRGWTLKEAYLKGTGEGLPGGLESLELSIQSDAMVAPRALRGSAKAILDWQFFSFEPAPGFVGAVAVYARRRPAKLLMRTIDPEVSPAWRAREVCKVWN